MMNFFLVWLIATKLVFLSPFMVEGQSMEPNLHNGEMFVIDRLVNRNGDLKRGEIVVFSFDGEYFYVKRVIGLPGETVRIGGEKVEIKNENGDFQTLNEVYLLGGKYNYGDQRYFLVPEGKYFVLGDNRDNSKDSRTFTYPFVELGKIYGRYVYP
jgi:signal peptidase I